MGSNPQEKVYVAVGKDVEEGLCTLRWALRKWSSHPVSFVILHVTTTSKDFVQSPFGKVLARSVSDGNLEVFRAKEHEKVDKLLSKYMALCCKVRAEVQEFEKSEEPIQKVLVDLISSLEIKRFVMGFTNTKSWKAKNDAVSCYVHKNKPEFCELFIVCGGRLIFFIEEKDNGGYLKDEQGAIVADFRKKLLSKGSFKEWFGRKPSDNASSSTDNQRSPKNAVSDSGAGIVSAGILSDRWEDNAEEIDRYIQNSLAPNSPELEIGCEITEPAKLETMHQSSINRTEALRAIKEAKKIVEERKNHAKVEAERRQRAERIISICNKRAEEVEENLREEMSKEAHAKEELEAVREQLKEVCGNITENKSKLTLVSNQHGYLTAKLQAYSMLDSHVKAETRKAESEKGEMLRHMEDIRQRRDMVRKTITYLKERKATGAMNNGYREFSEQEMRDATDGFSEGCIIGAGAKGEVYKGQINQTTVAIQLMTLLPLEEFLAEVDLLRRIRHPHLLSMIGVCIDLRCIVFEYMQLGTLHEVLFASAKKQHIPWHTRFRIATNLCSALGFLHSSQPRPTVHGRLSSSCILVDRNYMVKITGLCASASTSTDLPPASDVVALGMIILQLITGMERVGLEEVKSVVDNVDKKGGNWDLELTTELARIGLQYAASCRGEGVTEEMSKELEELSMKTERRVVHGAGDKHMHSEDGRTDMPNIFLCPIFQEVMKEPYVAADGFSYELEAIEEWLKTGHVTSPMTNLKLKHTNLTPNHTLRSLINDWHNNS